MKHTPLTCMILHVLFNNFVGFPLQSTLIAVLWSASWPVHDRAGQVRLMAEAGGWGGGDLNQRAGLFPGCNLG